MRTRFFRRSAIRSVVLALTLLAAFAQVSAQKEVGRLVAIIGIPREISPVETRLEEPVVTRIQGLVFTSGTIEKTRIVAVRSGAGKVDAAIAATLLLDHFTPSAVIFTGTAGALDLDLSSGDVVIATAVGYHDFGIMKDSGFSRSPTRNPISGQLDPRFFPADPELLSAARRAAKIVQTSRGHLLDAGATPQIREGLIVTGDAFIASAAYGAELRRELNAAAVEMEGAAVMQVCARFGVPAIVIRSITDRADAQAADSYRRFVEAASRNAADLALATAHEFVK
jgi:adenosylhomocysteine nucleosidase